MTSDKGWGQVMLCLLREGLGYFMCAFQNRL